MTLLKRAKQLLKSMKIKWVIKEKSVNSDLRIDNHPILEFKRGKRITFQFEGKQIEAYEKESIAAALFASGVKVFSRSKRFDNPKGWFCGIGKCCSCM